MHEVIAAKNLLNETSCYQCRYLDKEVGRCGLHMKDLPPDLHCEDYSTVNPLHNMWSPTTLKDIEAYMSSDAESELIKATGKLVEDE